MLWDGWKFKPKMPWRGNEEISEDEAHYSLVDEHDNSNPAKERAPSTRELPYKTLFFSLVILNFVIILAGGVFLKMFRTNDVVGYEPPGYIPETFTPHNIPFRYVEFQPNITFSRTLEGEPGSPWEELIPPGKGFVQVAEPGKYGLHGGYPTPWDDAPDAEAYSISMFHQLHCIRELKKAFLGLLPAKFGVHMDLDAADLVGSFSPKHLYHCFDYMRQSIMCAGDLSLEKPEAVGGKVTMRVNGWGDTHKCRDWESMYQWSARNRGKNNVTGLL